MITIKPKYVVRVGAAIVAAIVLYGIIITVAAIVAGNNTPLKFNNSSDIMMSILCILPIFLYGVWEILRRKNEKLAIFMAILFWASFIVFCGIMYLIGSFLGWGGLSIDGLPTRPTMVQRVAGVASMSLLPVSIVLSGLYVVSEVIDKRRKN